MMYIIIIILIIQWIARTAENHRIAKNYGWRAYKKSYDTFIYGQRFGDRWKEIEIRRSYRYLYGDFYIDFKDSNGWKEYPIWAQDRDAIMERVISLYPDHKPQNSEIDDIGLN